jgi:xylose isomerase
MELAKLKADVAFEMFRILGVPFFCFHDADVRPEGADFAESTKNGSRRSSDYFAAKMEATGVKLLWGTANLFSNRRYMAGAATNPDPDVFAFAAATVKPASTPPTSSAANYVLWGGREGYETLLNTDLKREDASRRAASSTWWSSTSTRSALTAPS